MNRIEKYQDSIDRFFKNKSYLTYLDKNECNVITESIKKNKFLITIFLLTLTNNINKKNKIHQHGYYIGSSMELVFLIPRVLEKNKLFNLNENLLVKITNLSNILLVQNLELASAVLTKDKLLKNYNSTIKQLNNKIINIFNNKFQATDKIITTDLLNYKFKNPEFVRNQLKKSYKCTKDDFIKYIEDKYCSVIELAASLTWNLGGGNENMTKHIEKLGYYYGFLIKIYNDILEIEFDINDNYPNIIINLGIQETFESFMYYKKKFIELLMKTGLYSNTIKELIDFIEDILDKFLENTTPDLREEIEI
jgi:hypothetical protein